MGAPRQYFQSPKSVVREEVSAPLWTCGTYTRKQVPLSEISEIYGPWYRKRRDGGSKATIRNTLQGARGTTGDPCMMPNSKEEIEAQKALNHRLSVPKHRRRLHSAAPH